MTLRRLARSRAAPDAHARGSFAVSTSRLDLRAPRLPGPGGDALASSAFATPRRRPRGRTCTSGGAQRPRSAPRRERTDRALAVLARAAPRPPVRSALRSRPFLRPRPRADSAGRAPRPRTPPRARGSASSAAVARRTFTAAREPGQQVVRREILERVEARAELVHIDTVEELGRLAQREVARRPRRGRARCRARNHSAVQGPIPRSAVRRARTSSSRSSRERVEIEVGAREPDHVLGLAAREADARRARLSVAAATRARVGKGERVLAALARNARSSGCGSRTPRTAKPAAR